MHTPRQAKAILNVLATAEWAAYEMGQLGKSEGFSAEQALVKTEVDGDVCYCGMIVPKGRLHYPGNDPENGPAHRPQPVHPEPTMR